MDLVVVDLLGFLGGSFLGAKGLRGLDRVLVGAEKSIAPCEVLSVVVLEVSVVDVVVPSTVDELPISEGDAVVNGGGPDGHGHEQNEVGQFMHGDDVGAEPVGPGLRPGVQWVEGECSERAGVDKRMVELVHGLVEQITVKGVVDPVNAEIRDYKEEDDRECPVSQREGHVVEVIEVMVDLGVALFKRKVDGRVDESNHEYCDKSGPQLPLDLP
jgi:hypothetical protein